jgi:hypothetical protein
MRKSSDQKRRQAAGGFTLGRASFAKISAVEGVKLSDAMRSEFREFDRQNLPADERRRRIVAKHGRS